MKLLISRGRSRQGYAASSLVTSAACFGVAAVTFGIAVITSADTPLPAPGQWDGVTEKARLDRPYEDQRQATVPFGLISYFAQPWRSYMDTWPSKVFPDSLAFVMNVGDRDADAICKVMSEAGIRQARYEVGWGNFSWNDKLEGAKREGVVKTLQLFKKYNIRPLILLNSHHAAPCPFKNIFVELTEDAHKGDISLKVKDAHEIVPIFTGPMHAGEYCAAKPLVTSVDDDGTVHLSDPLPDEIKAGRQPLWVLKYQPVHGVEEKGASPERNAMWAREAQRTLDGWKLYVQETCALVQEALGTAGQKDSGFDLEVWNEQTFGSNFLNLSNYYAKAIEFTKPVTFTRQRPLTSAIRPDAATEFKTEGYGCFLGITSTYIDENRDKYPGVKVDNGFGNQWPWNGPGDAWPAETAMSRHFYLGSWRDISPKTARPDMMTIDALGQKEGIRPNPPKDWYDIVPGTNFIPTVKTGLPEWGYTAFQAENIIRDVMPYGRLTGGGNNHGRYSHNGDFVPAEVWQTEFNYGRQGFFDRLFEETKAAKDDPRALALDSWITSKLLLRQYAFQNHKGLKRLYVFAPGEGSYGINMFPSSFLKSLEKNGGKLTDETQALLPAAYKGLAWMCQQMNQGRLDIDAPRCLRVDDLWEYKPRLQYAGDGTPAHPHQWNREWFAFMPYQVNISKYVIPYYVVTLDVNQIYDQKKDPFDPARYSMPDQDFEVTIGNCAGTGAKVSAYDPLTNTAVPATIVKSTANTLTVRLKTVDYPRVLVVEEAKSGPQILEPKATADAAGNLTLSWKTNIPVNAVKVSYGKDWPNRSANEMTVPAGKSDYSVKIPTGSKGVLAARIKVAVNGLTCTWPKYDEDVAGQVVVPGSTKNDVTSVVSSGDGSGTTTSSELPQLLAAVPGVDLPVKEPNPTRQYTLQLPAGASLTGPLDDREGTLGTGAKALYLRVRYLTGNGKTPELALPFAAVGDIVTKRRVKLGNAVGLVADYTFVPAQHPGMTRYRQRYFVMPAGISLDDLLVVTVQGSGDSLTEQEKLIDAIFAGITLK